jgi:hypothetical protein
MENRANNKNRPTYNCVGNSCATEADEAIKAGWNPNLSFLDKTKAYI